MSNIIKIKCPRCGSILSVNEIAGIETKNVTCPVCEYKGVFTDYKKVLYQDPETEYGNPNLTIGILKIMDTNVSYQLKLGRNVIGRKSTTSKANFQINTGEKRSMSREHIVIDVKEEKYKGFVHYISLYKEKVNKTFVGSEQLHYNDCVIILKQGDIIKLPDAVLIFDIPDDEATRI